MWTGGSRRVRFWSSGRSARYRPSTKALQTRRPHDLTRFQIQRKRRVEEIVSHGAVRQWSRVLARFHFCRRRVVVSGTDKEHAALGINRRRVPKRASPASSPLSGIIRHVGGLSNKRAR